MGIEVRRHMSCKFCLYDDCKGSDGSGSPVAGKNYFEIISIAKVNVEAKYPDFFEVSYSDLMDEEHQGFQA